MKSTISLFKILKKNYQSREILAYKKQIKSKVYLHLGLFSILITRITKLSFIKIRF
jgi:hypothetical protein